MSRSENGNLIEDGRAAEVPPWSWPWRDSRVAQEAATISGTPPAGSENSVDYEGNGLVRRVRAKRADVERYLRVVGVRRRRLVIVTILGAAIATLLTALAAILGPQLASLFGTGPNGWRMLCALAAVFSLTAGVATQLHTSKNYGERITRAEDTMATLEALEEGITLGHLHQNEAGGQYLKIIQGTSFMHSAG
jgi:hypothetical protein